MPAETTTPETARGLCLRCPACHEASAVVLVNLAAPDEFRCQECEEDFTADHVRQLIEGARRWEKVLTWLSSMPGEP